MSADEHLRVHSRCGACGFLFGEGDRFCVLSADSLTRQKSRADTSATVVTNDADENPTHITSYGWFNFPRSLYFEDNRLCRMPGCKYCQSVEASTIHKHCLELFLRRVGASTLGGSPTNNEAELYLLWVTATRKSPWKGASNLDVRPFVRPCLSDIQSIAGGDSSLTGLEKLSQEVIETIWDLCNDLWYCSVLDLTDQLSALQNDVQNQQRTIPLTDIKDWIRGGKVCLGYSPNDSIIRLSSDSRGLARIERLGHLDADGSSRSDYMGYIVEAAERFAGSFVDFQFGMARLRGLTGPVHIWDTPYPPPLRRSIVDNSIIVPTPYPRDVHLGTVELSGCTGITFFVAHGSIYAVHSHTKADLYAYRTFENIAPARRMTVAWIYVPLHGLTEIGFSWLKNQHGLVTLPQHLWFRFESAREVLIGPYKTTPRDFVSLKMPQTLIYKKTDKLSICFIGGFSENDTIRDTAAPKPPHRTPSAWWVAQPYISSAPLENIERIRVYFFPETSFCRGLLLEYQMGGSLALGQCRLGVDQFRQYERPTLLWFSNTTCQRLGEKEVKRVQIQIECSDYHIKVDEQFVWTCCDMVGVLYAWFNQDEMQVEYENTN